jgi:hypothetical protein
MLAKASPGWGRDRSGVAIPQRFLAERTLDSPRNGIADPDDSTEQENGNDKLKSGNHDSSP